MKQARLEGPLAVVGLGRMGGILVQSFIEKGIIAPRDISATVRRSENAEPRARQFGIAVSNDNLQAVKDSKVILLCVKPQAVAQVCREISEAMQADQLVISIAAGVPTGAIERELGIVPVVRAMPNTPCVIGHGMTGICGGRFATSDHLELARMLFEAVGRSVTVEEKLMDAVTGLSGSGPAFLYIILESLAEGGVKVGLPRDVSTLLAAQTASGAAQMILQSGSHPATLKDAVTTPAGCTIDGIMELEEGKLRVTLIKAVVKATQRARELMPD
ncbi:MAG: pyrroline-5-carboxylate reductase [Acidobacteriota bacterium]